jgi:Amt family ammonium transporter
MIKLSLILGLLMACTPVVHADETAGTPASPAAAAPSAASTSAPTAPPPAAPFMLAADKLSSGDTAWMLTSTALVLMMCVPGLALFYGKASPARAWSPFCGG